MITRSRLHELLAYDPDTGVFAWRARTSNRVKIGGVAGHISDHGYRVIKIDGRRYLAHRLAWLYVYGAFPADQTDHRNGIRDDNRVANLREATHGENGQNRAKNRNNTSGFACVYWNRATRKWRAQIGIGGKKKYIGLFDDPRTAHEAYLAAKAELHTFQPTPQTGETNG